MIRFDRVTKRFPDGTVAVDELDLTAPTGRITVLVGPSGCGKTTSLRMVNRMIEPTSGTIHLDGRDTADLDRSPAGRRRQPDSALTAIAWGFAVVPAVLVALSVIPLVRYRLDQGEVEAAVSAAGARPR